MANSVQWLYVRYADNMTADCPISFVDPEENFEDPSCFDSKKFYSIFWSKEEDDTPEKMAKRVATIPRFDRSDKSGRPGYYPARILDCGESEEDLDRKKTAKRISIPSEKVLCNSQVINTGQRRGKGANRTSSVEKRKIEQNRKSGKSAREENTEDTSRKRAAPTSSPVERPADSGTRSSKVARYREYQGVPIDTDILGFEEDDALYSSDCSDDQTVIPEKIHKTRVESLEKKIRRLEKKLDQKDEEVKELRKTLDAATALNLQYQQDFIGKLIDKVKNCSCSIPSTSSIKNDSNPKSIPTIQASVRSSALPLNKHKPNSPPPRPADMPSRPPNLPSNNKPAASITPTSAPTTSAPTTSAPTTSAPPTSAPPAPAPTAHAPTAPGPDAAVAGGDLDNSIDDRRETLDQAADVENNSNEIVEIHPGIKVNRASWSKIAECVETNVTNTTKYPNTEPGDRDFVYLVAQQMWGTNILSRSTVTGKGFKGKKDVDGTPLTPSGDALPPLELDTVHGALRKRILLLNDGDDPKRSSFTAFKSLVRQKIHNVKKTIKK